MTTLIDYRNLLCTRADFMAAGESVSPLVRFSIDGKRFLCKALNATSVCCFDDWVIMLRALIVVGIGLLAGAQNVLADGAVVVRAIEGNFAEIRERVVFAVQSQGLVVDHTAKVGGMLERTGKDLGETKQIFGEAEVLEFCSALVSRKMVDADPQLLAFCPYGIAVYTLPGDPETTYVSYRRMVTNLVTPVQRPVLERVEKLLQAIVEEAAM
jgi:uncharacterized protein (DUF302 family)